ncbi:HtaA domain-containing protein [Streptomyces malaysiensis subsp. malaysiensis]|uniref:HtaA domain-containing protein n=1 Tax=Streptomyces malaysiensis TaxID=92644 RepID=A0ABX6W572_STRMQ|nr:MULTISPECIES: HtaA domain-containing protein [Streptomyces]QPI55909.1 HtaA domain-containing protein [Streptomyces solisilvae]UHH17381.1 HtaA domain-containing protein [Streptomyces sp. HNM0561]
MLPLGPAEPSRQVRTSTALTAAAVLTLTLCATLLSGPAARAADRTVAGGRLDWGIKSSFQSYVTGPIAKGSWSLRNGAATVGSDQFRFHSATGSYDPADGAFDAAFSGGVRFLGHRRPNGSYQLDLTISSPTVRIAQGGGSGTLYADMTGKAKGSGEITSARQVPLATLDIGGVTMRGGGSTVVLNHLPAKLTSRGAEAFAGYYAAGTELDPVSLSVDAPARKPSAEPTQGPSAERDKDRPRGAFTTAAVDWGVRRTFREYVTGPIAKGEWRLSRGAQDGGALFRFPGGKGTYDERRHTLSATFQGRIAFRGKDLDLALSGVSLRIADGRGTLAADVTRDGTTDKAVPVATFKAPQLRPEKGLIALTEAPATLTSRGAEAFGGLYRAGTAMDPVSLAVALDAGAALPPLPDLGDSPSATPERSAEAEARHTASPAAASSSSDSSAAPWVAAGAGGALLIAAAVLVPRWRRRRAAAAPPDRPAR